MGKDGEGGGEYVWVEEQAVEGSGSKWRPVVRWYKGEMAVCQSEEGEPWDGIHLTIVFQEAVSFLWDYAEGVSKICLRSVHLPYLCCVDAFPVHWLPWWVDPCMWFLQKDILYPVV